VKYNGLKGAGAISVDMINPEDKVDGGIPGHNTAVLEAAPAGWPVEIPAAIAQSIQIPVGSTSVLFVATPPNGRGWQVTIDNQSISVIEIAQVDSRFNQYGADISRFAGQIHELRFSALPGTTMWLGEIQFSPSVARPQLKIVASGNNGIVVWPTNLDGYFLQSTTNLALGVWTANLPEPVIRNGQNFVTNSISGTQQFFRLSH